MNYTSTIWSAGVRPCPATAMCCLNSPTNGPRQRTRRSRGVLGIRFTDRSGSGFQPAMVRAHSRACALSVMPGNWRRGSQRHPPR
jgi:hypothetical protein